MRKSLLLLLLLFVSILSAEWVDIPENTEQKLFDHSSIGKEYTEVSFTLNGYHVETIRADETDYQKISYLNEGNSL
ncbi:MAG: hypothetical protein PF570_05900, partial [Candidatus Cloacimonetes bacterium]|nr:hypothetical protein [Candidatus Cloacimonadota bacterium]